MPTAPSTPKVAFVSHVLPPSSSGQAVVLYRLLRDWDPDQYCFISTKDYPAADSNDSSTDVVTKRLPAVYHRVPAEKQYRVLESTPFGWLRATAHLARRVLRGNPPVTSYPAVSASPPVAKPPTAVPKPSVFKNLKTGLRGALQSWDDWINLRVQVQQRADAIARIVALERCTAVVACSGDLIDMPASYIAAKRCGVPYFSYMLDDYPHQWSASSQRRYAQAVSLQLIKQADGVIVPNEFLANAYRDEFGIESTIVRNPVEELPVFTQTSDRPTAGKPFRIVYTGMIYQAHFDAFIRLVQALDGIPRGKVELHIYTKGDPAFLSENGIGHPAILHPSVTNAESIELQRSADLLFLPLAFCSNIPEIIRTSAPGKMGEYFASGKPVLAHGPKDSFLSWYCRTHECAAVVDEPNVDELRQMLVELIQRPTWVDRMVENAWQRARDDYHLPRVQERFRRLFAA